MPSTDLLAVLPPTLTPSGSPPFSPACLPGRPRPGKRPRGWGRALLVEAGFQGSSVPAAALHLLHLLRPFSFPLSWKTILHLLPRALRPTLLRTSTPTGSLMAPLPPLPFLLPPPTPSHEYPNLTSVLSKAPRATRPYGPPLRTLKGQSPRPRSSASAVRCAGCFIQRARHRRTLCALRGVGWGLGPTWGNGPGHTFPKR